MIDNFMLLSKETGFILKPFALLIGYVIEGIYWCLDKIGIPNIGLSIILLTLIIYLLMLPLTYKQQKFSKLQSKMSPELQAIQLKYKDKKDQDSMMKMQAETQALYAKYGVSPSGSCLQLLIQMPILFSLYRVISNVPAYIGKIKDAYYPLVTKLLEKDDATDLLQSFENAKMFMKQFNNPKFTLENTYIDILNKASTSEWLSIGEKFKDLANDVNNTLIKVEQYNNFLGVNIGNSPSYTLKAAWGMAEKNWFIIIFAILIPVLSALTQYINVLLMPQPQQNAGSDEANSMMASMKTMNRIMPLFSAYMCFILPLGLGIYWIAGAVIRTIIQIILNKKIDKIDLDGMIKENIEKYNEKRAKQGLPAQVISNNATVNTRNINTNKSGSKYSAQERAAQIKESTDYYKNSANAKEGSLASKAFMVKNYNEKNNDKK